MASFVISVLYGLTIGVALSVDAFMLALVFGSTFRRKRETVSTSMLVGAFHFFMPIIGYFLTLLVFKHVNLTARLSGNAQYITFAILLLLGLLMIFKKEDNGQFNIRSLINKFLFACSVSIDAFLTGIAFTTLDHINIYVTSILFSIVSASLTFIALSIGKKTAEKLLKYRLDFYAGILMMILAFITLFL